MDATQDSEARNKLTKIGVPLNIYTLIATASGVDGAEDGQMHAESSRTELDSHANMPVVGRHTYVISDTGEIADVSPFTSDYSSMQIRVVDAAVK